MLLIRKTRHSASVSQLDGTKLEKYMPLNIGEEINYSLADNDVVRTIPSRITTLAFHPRADRVVLACGGEGGPIALWSPLNYSNCSSAVLFQPHEAPVCQLLFPEPSKLIISSVDGTMREFDLETVKSSLVCDISDETGITSFIGLGSTQLYYASCVVGTLRLIDCRTRNVRSASYTLHQKKINSVDQHPGLDFCIATASQDDTVCLWDARKISSSKQNTPLTRLRHANNTHCAHFSPDGSWLTTVGHDSYIDMYDTSNLTAGSALEAPLTLPKAIRVPHTTKTGISIKIRPAWDPKRKNRFVIGC